MAEQVDTPNKPSPKGKPYRIGAGPRPRNEGVASFLRRTGRPKAAHAFELATRDGGRRAWSIDRDGMVEFGPEGEGPASAGWPTDAEARKAERAHRRRATWLTGLATRGPSTRNERRAFVRNVTGHVSHAPALRGYRVDR